MHDPLREGLEVELKFLEGTGTLTLDSSGKRNHGTFKGDGEPAWVAGGGVDFDGGDDEIDLGTGFDPIDTISVFAVVEGVPDNTRNYVAGRDYGQTGFMIHEDNNYWEGVIYTVDDGSQFIWQSGEAADTNRHCVGITYDKDAGANNAKLWLDGVEIAQRTSTGQITRAGYKWDLGCHGNSGNFWEGKIYSFRIWNRVLSDAEIRMVAGV